MAVFQFQNRTIAYQTVLAPFAEDLVLLQGSKFTPDFWRHVIEEIIAVGPPAGGRIMTCEWSEAGRTSAQLGEDLSHLLRTLGLHKTYVVACDDAAEAVKEAERVSPSLFEKTLLFPSGGPRGEALTRALLSFCPLDP